MVCLVPESQQYQGTYTESKSTFSSIEHPKFVHYIKLFQCVLHHQSFGILHFPGKIETTDEKDILTRTASIKWFTIYTHVAFDVGIHKTATWSSDQFSAFSIVHSKKMWQKQLAQRYVIVADGRQNQKIWGKKRWKMKFPSVDG